MHKQMYIGAISLGLQMDRAILDPCISMRKAYQEHSAETLCLRAYIVSCIRLYECASKELEHTCILDALYAYLESTAICDGVVGVFVCAVSPVLGIRYARD
jgi:hypothetical protein